MTHSRNDLPAELPVLLAAITVTVLGAVYTVFSGVYSTGIHALKR